MTKRFEMPCVNVHGVCTEHVLAYVVVVVNITSIINVITNNYYELAKKKLGWNPKFQRKEGLKKTIEYFEKLLEGDRSHV